MSELTRAEFLNDVIRATNQDYEAVRRIKDNDKTLRAQLAALSPTWSAAKPTVPGWYWWRKDEDCPGLIVEVQRDFFDGRRLLGYWDMRRCLVEKAGGEWAGPLPSPREK